MLKKIKAGLAWLLRLERETVATVTRDFHAVVARLEAVEEKAMNEAAELAEEIDRLMIDRSVHLAEAASAQHVAGKMRSLLMPEPTQPGHANGA